MSPASQGGLHVERYIGTCLISKVDPYRYHGGAHGTAHSTAHSTAHGAWAGLPLISMVQPRRNNNGRKTPNHPGPAASPGPPGPSGSPLGPPGPPQHTEGPGRSPLSRLAIHTQGAPIILTGRYNNNNNNNRKNGPHCMKGVPVARVFRGGDLVRAPCLPCAPKPNSPIDSLSVASDESSGHSENSLPRIIKPRKRRKKDRKPQCAPQQDAEAAVVPTVSLKNIEVDVDGPAPADEPKLHHDFDEVKEHEHDEEEGSERGLTLCQCRYCDPAGLIWDVDQNCYSPFLTPPTAPPTRTSSALFPDLRDLRDDLHADVREPRDVRDPRTSDLLLRRSWSEPSPLRKSSESSDSQEIGRRSPRSRQALEVSSEIVTSHNGHRDIEIKFFSRAASPTRSPATSGEEDVTDCKE